MSMLEHKQFSPTKYKEFTLDSPGFGGLNIQDLEYNLNKNQSPDMLNMMLRNGALTKRYGQEEVKQLNANVLAMGEYTGCIMIQTDDGKIYKYMPVTDELVEIYSGVGDLEGIFINYNGMVYFLNRSKYIQYDGTTCEEVDSYAPDVIINRTPDGTSGDLIEDFNMLGDKFKQAFNGDGTSRVYHLLDTDDVTYSDTKPKIWVDEIEIAESNYTYDKDAKTVTFNAAPSKGQNNVVIQAYYTETEYADKIMSCKYWITYGGQNNSRLFLGGCGDSTYRYSEVFDASYFPESQYASIGNSEFDITGFGAQYSAMIVFKPAEIYGITYAYTEDTNGELKALFGAALIHADIGCDMPDTIQYVDNRVTWGNSNIGICSLISTVLENERNVQVISRNVNGGARVTGLIDEENTGKCLGIRFDGKYLITCTSGNVYAWDYTYSPYSTSNNYSVDDKARMLSWFKWDNVFIDSYVVYGRELFYSHGGRISKLNWQFNDYGEAIHAHLMTPMMDFGAIDYLKTVRKVWFFVRGDTPSITKVKYITSEEWEEGIEEPEDIIINTRLWKEFTWETWGWSFHKYARSFARKCSIKKIPLFGIFMSNDEADRDMSISQIKMQFNLVKEIK